MSPRTWKSALVLSAGLNLALLTWHLPAYLPCWAALATVFLHSAWPKDDP